MKRLEVGVNYAWPWNKPGVYFGSGESRPGENPDYAIWVDNLYRNLGVLESELGVRTVRLFLFWNAHNFGRIASVRRNPVTRKTWAGGPQGWEFQLPGDLHPSYPTQLEAALQAFSARGMKVILSLLSFEALARWRSSGGRGDLAADTVKRERFLDMVLDPFLAISTRYASAIKAWEAVNEPGQVVRRPLKWLINKTDLPIPRATMVAFLNAVLERIEARGFASTVGHWFARDMSLLPTGTLRQFHYYPSTFSARVLPRFEQTHAFIGELAAAPLPAGQRHAALWPGIDPRDQRDVATCTFKRLELVEQRGYELAFLWPDVTEVHSRCLYDPQQPWIDDLHFTAEAQEGIRRFQSR